MNDRDRYLSKLSPDELLLWVSRGGELVTREMKAGYARALGSVGLKVAPTAAALAELLKELCPRWQGQAGKAVDLPPVSRRQDWPPADGHAPQPQGRSQAQESEDSSMTKTTTHRSRDRYPAPRGGKGTFGCRAARPTADHLDALSRHYAALGIVGNQMRGVDHGGGTGQ